LKGPAGVLALVLAETVAGAAALLFLTPLWGEVRRGFFKLTGIVIAVLALASWGSIAAARRPGSVAGEQAWWLALALTVATAAWVVLMFARAERPARALGFLTVPVSLALLGALAGTADHSHVVAFLQLLAGAAFMGAVVDGLLLGHWYLTDRRLTRRPIDRFTAMLLVAVVLETAAVIAGGFGATGTSRELSPLLTAAGVASYVAVGMVLATALIAVMIRLTLRGTRATAVQAATGFFYLAVITAFTAELAAKIRFLR
jgi:hypothetical protein